MLESDAIIRTIIEHRSILGAGVGGSGCAEFGACRAVAAVAAVCRHFLATTNNDGTTHMPMPRWCSTTVTAGTSSLGPGRKSTSSSRSPPANNSASCAKALLPASRSTSRRLAFRFVVDRYITRVAKLRHGVAGAGATTESATAVAAP